MVEHVIRAAGRAGCKRAVIIESNTNAVQDAFAGKDLKMDLEFVVQDPPQGTGDAVRCAMSALRPGDLAVILNGDIPCITSDSITRVVDAHRDGGLSFAVAHLDDATGYGRIVRDAQGAVVAIREHRDCSQAELELTEVNLGLYVAGHALLERELAKLTNDNDQGEYYLTDLVDQTAAAGGAVEAAVFDDLSVLQGVNDRSQLATAERTVRMRVLEGLMREGVTLIDPERTLVERGIEIGSDTTIEADVTIRGDSSVGEGCHIGQGCHITDGVLENNIVLKPYSVLEGATLKHNSKAGPFARLRPGTVLHQGSSVGNFVELKKTELGPGSKAGHHAYLGDAIIGEKVNVGAGTITCNYDGKNKHKTILDDGVFVGSDTQFVAPVHVGEGAYIGAGTTVTEDVPAWALAISRVRQLNKEGWVEQPVDTRSDDEKTRT